MEEGYLCVHYKTLPHCTVQITVRAELAVFVELLNGYAFIKEDDRTIHILSSKHRYLLESISPILFSESGCSFKVYGCHEVFSFTCHGNKPRKRMFELIDEGSKVKFVLKKSFQIMIYHREEIRPAIMEFDDDDDQEVLGPVLYSEKNPEYHYLPPLSQFLIRYKDSEYNDFTISINKPTEKLDFFISPCNNKIFIRMKTILYRSLARGNLSPRILILGNRCNTYNSFCHTIFNDAFEHYRNIVYVDLNVRQNSNGIPGSLRIIQVSDRRTVDDRGCHKSEVFWGNDESVFSFGYVDPKSNIKLYYLLLNRLADLASQMSQQESVRIAGTFIDMRDVLSNNLIAARRAIEAFDINTIVVVGNRKLYLSIKEIDMPCHIVKRSITGKEDFQPPSYNLHNSVIREYVRWTQNVFLIKFSDIEIFEIKSKGTTDNIEISTVFNLAEVRTVPVVCGEHLENHLLGVSECSKKVQELPVTRVKYFVFVMKVDMEKETLQIKSPKAERLSGAILIKGDIKLLTENES